MTQGARKLDQFCGPIGLGAMKGTLKIAKLVEGPRDVLQNECSGWGKS